MIQALLAAALAIPFFFRTHVSKLVHRLRGQREELTDEESGPRD